MRKLSKNPKELRSDQISLERRLILFSALTLSATAFPVFFNLAEGAELQDIQISELLGLRKSGHYADQFVIETVYFATNRRPTGFEDAVKWFGKERADRLSYGTAQLLLPRYPLKDIKFSSQPDQSIRVNSSRTEYKASLYGKARAARKRVMIYVHGFNTSWTHAITTAARLNNKIGSGAPMVAFIWPSREKLWQYKGDEDEIEWSSNYLQLVVSDILEAAQIEHVDIVAHSMGARAVVTALSGIFKSANRFALRKVRNIVFAAADIEQAVMDRDFVPIARFMKTIRPTIYISNVDFPMWMSEFLHGRPRVGSRQITVYRRPGFVTIDVTAVDQSAWGHSALFQTDEVATDLYYLVAQGLPPEHRRGLSKIDLPDGLPYWRLIR